MILRMYSSSRQTWLLVQALDMPSQPLPSMSSEQRLPSYFYYVSALCLLALYSDRAKTRLTKRKLANDAL